MPDDPPKLDEENIVSRLNRAFEAQADVFKSQPLNALAGLKPKGPAWYRYYWKILKCCGAESYRTWRGEMLASVLIAIAAFFLTAPDDPFAAKNLQVVLLATAIGLGVMGLWHLIRAPWVLQRRMTLNQKEDDKWGWGLFGSLIVVGILFGGYYGSVRAYRAKIPALVVNMPSPDPGAKNAEIIIGLTQKVEELENELRAKPSVITRNVPVPTSPVSTSNDNSIPPAVFDEIGNLADRGFAIQNNFIQAGDTEAIKKAYVAWVTEGIQMLTAKIGSSYAVQFRNAHGNSAMGCPVGRSLEGCGPWQDIQGKREALMVIITELRQRR